MSFRSSYSSCQHSDVKSPIYIYMRCVAFFLLNYSVWNEIVHRWYLFSGFFSYIPFFYSSRTAARQEKRMYVYMYIYTQKQKQEITHEYNFSDIANSSLSVYNTLYIRNQKRENKKQHRKKTKDSRPNKEYSICNEWWDIKKSKENKHLFLQDTHTKK